MSSKIETVRICQECGKKITARTTKTRFCTLRCNREPQKAGARCEGQEERKGDGRKTATSYRQPWCKGISVRQVISQIQDYVFENHPDLLDADDVIILMCLFSQRQQAYKGYLASHVLSYEASAQAFSDIYSSLNSDYVRLKEFIRNNMEDLSAIAGFPIEDNRESILNLLPKLRKVLSKDLASFDDEDWQELMFVIPKLR